MVPDVLNGVVRSKWAALSIKCVDNIGLLLSQDVELQLAWHPLRLINIYDVNSQQLFKLIANYQARLKGGSKQANHVRM